MQPVKSYLGKPDVTHRQLSPARGKLETGPTCDQAAPPAGWLLSSGSSCARAFAILCTILLDRYVLIRRRFSSGPYHDRNYLSFLGKLCVRSLSCENTLSFVPCRTSVKYFNIQYYEFNTLTSYEETPIFIAKQLRFSSPQRRKYIFWCKVTTVQCPDRYFIYLFIYFFSFCSNFLLPPWSTHVSRIVSEIFPRFDERKTPRRMICDSFSLERWTEFGERKQFLLRLKMSERK